MTDGKTRANALIPAVALLVMVWMSWGAFPLSGQSATEEALRTRVEELYTALQQGNLALAELYVTKESRQVLVGGGKTPPLAHAIQSIKVDPAGDTATVVVSVTNIIPMIGQPISTPQTTHWRLLEDVWYAELPKPDPQALQKPFTTPQPRLPASALRARVHSKDLKFDYFFFSLGEMYGDDVKVARFPFTNISDHNVTISDVKTTEYTRLKTQQKEFKPGEAAVLEFAVEPPALSAEDIPEAFSQTVLVTTQPENAVTTLTIGAGLYPPRTPPAKSKPASGPAR
jgi:hypothetical protein